MDRGTPIRYFDHAATSWPKPPAVGKAITGLLERGCANPGRSGHRLSIETARTIFSVRAAAADLLGISDPLRLVFTANATMGLNMAVSGLVRSGDHVITSSMEHNSVMRPLRAMEAAGASLTVLHCDKGGILDPCLVESSIRPETRMIILTHASNVTGTIMPVEAVAAVARERGVLFCLDAAQTAGALPISVEAMGIDILVFTGHKSLYGPQGTGGLYLRRGLEKEMTPLLKGGTGSLSEQEKQPLFMPDRYEPGTPNSPGIAGLGAGIEFVTENGVDTVNKKEKLLLRRFLEGLSCLKKVIVHGTGDPESMIPVVSLSIVGMEPSLVSQVLDEEYSIMTRPGLHCAPAAHRTLGTYPQGTVRFSFGCLTDEEDIDAALEALDTIAG